MTREIIKCFNDMIKKILELNNNTYSDEISSKVLDILTSKDKVNTQMFFDFFNTVDSDDRNFISDTCIHYVVNNIYHLVSELVGDRIDMISSFLRHVEDTDKHSILNIVDTYAYPDIPFYHNNDIVDTYNSFNMDDKTLIYSLCMNILKFSPNSIKYDLDLIISNKQDFINNKEKYKNNIVEVFSIYIPAIFRFQNSCYSGPFYLHENDIYFKMNSITDIIRDCMCDIEKNKIYEQPCVSRKDIIYYMIYQYYVNLPNNKEYYEYLNRVGLLLSNGISNIDLETFNCLLESTKFGMMYCSLDDQIDEIKNLRKLNINKILNLYASLEIAKYEKLEQKKKAFGLKL